MINFERIKLEPNDVLVLEQNIPEFPSRLVREDQFPISITINDWERNRRNLKIDKHFTLSLDGHTIPIQKLYETLYGISKSGQLTAYEYEADYFGPSQFDKNELPQSTDQIDALSKQFPFSYSPSNIRIKFLPHLNTIRYYGLGAADSPVAIKDYDLYTTGRKWQHRGVFRLPLKQVNSSEYVLIVETPIVADYLLKNGICAISLPSEKELDYYDYPSLLSGKNILFCLNSFGQKFSYSLYPLASNLLHQKITLYKVNLYNAFSNTSIPAWLNKHDPQQLLTKIRSNATALEASDIPTRRTYNTNAPSGGAIKYNPPQDVKKGSLIYSFGYDSIISKPLRTFSLDKITSMEKLIPSHKEPIQTRLDQDIVEHIKRGDYLQPTQLYQFILSFVKRFVYFEHKPTFDVLTSWIIGTYVYQLFQAFPYLHFMGKRGTGKTTILEILSQLSFNGKHLTKATPSSLIHQVHYHGSTLCIDEFEDYSSKRKSEDDLSRFLNGGYHYKGSYEKRSKGDTVVLKTYSPKAFGGTGDIFIDTLKSRSIQVKTLEKPNHIPKVQFVEFDDKIADDIRLIQISSFALGLTNTTKLFDIVASMSPNIRLPISNIKLDNRKLQLAKPLLTVAQLVEELNVKRNILEGLDVCWYEEAANQSQLFETIRDILKSFIEEHEPDNEDSAHLKFITKKLLDFDLKQKYEQDYELLRHKGKLNELLEERFDIQRDNQYAKSVQTTKSLYLIPRDLVEDLQG